jgi:hypothetical protein
MKYPLLLLILTSFVLVHCTNAPTSSHAAIGPVENQVLAVLNNPETQFFYTTDKIPPELLEKASQSAGYAAIAGFSMANRDEDFEAGCCSIMNKFLPSHRLIFMAALQERKVLYYESGGLAHSMTLCYAEKTDGQYNYYQGGLNGVEDFTNLEKVKLAIKEARFLVDKEKG